MIAGYIGETGNPMETRPDIASTTSARSGAADNAACRAASGVPAECPVTGTPALPRPS